MIKIIKATEKEAKEIEAIRMEMLKDVNHLPEDTVFDEAFVRNTNDYFRKADQTTVLATCQGEVIGCATICYIYLMPTFDHPGGRRAHIMNVYTRREYRRQGIAMQMMNMLIEEARQRGVTELSLDATEEGRPLYEKCGFIKSEECMVLNLK